MTLREVIDVLNKQPNSQKDKKIKYCGEWEGTIEKIEIVEHEGCLLLMLH